ncbi:hypothetical protein E5288_WYG002346 [Bos mutus]|uniref:RNA-binding S4 domain-containing protein n=1 Tax=Bos mutus TaxID=72004 RepID=A0A6B0R7H1_9CETA|nr:hypothetical protein [Bos mutus]
MARGPKKHLKRVAAPKHWMLDKLTGVFAPRPSTGPHKLRECLPLIIFLRNRLKYALTGDEVKKICMQRFIKIDGKVRTDITYPAGFMDVISIDKTGENFRLIYDTKGRFAVHRITTEEAKYKLCKVRKIFVGTKGIPHLVTHDARTIRYPDPLIKVNDTIQIDLETGKITDFINLTLATNYCSLHYSSSSLIEHEQWHNTVKKMLEESHFIEARAFGAEFKRKNNEKEKFFQG